MYDSYLLMNSMDSMLLILDVLANIQKDIVLAKQSTAQPNFHSCERKFN